MQETVPLPDAVTRPRLHPLDLPEARPLFRTGWWIGATTSVPIAALLAAIVGYLGGTIVPPILLFLSVAGFGWLANRWFTARAWDYLPRNRQDRQRRPPARWEITAAGGAALLLGVALVLVVLRLGRDDVPVEVRAFTYGMGAIAVALMVAGTLFALVRRRPAAGARLPHAAVAAGAVVFAYPTWFDGGTDDSLLFAGAAAMVVVAVTVGLVLRWRRLG